MTLHPTVRVFNTQRIEKADHNEDGALWVHSIFHTIQGEGPFTCHPAVFIRLAGCNLQCPQCDTEYSDRTQMSAQGVYRKVQRLHGGPRLVVITGGEPFRQNVAPLVQLLVDSDYTVQVETNGTLPVPDFFPANAFIVCSPKTGKVHPTVEEAACAYKYVLSADSVDPDDGLPTLALHHSASPRVARPPERLMTTAYSQHNQFPRGAVYVQPADVKDTALNGRNLQAAVRSCMRHGYTLQLQVHKILGME